MASIGVFSSGFSEEKQLAELRQYYAERGVQIEKSGLIIDI